MFKEKRKPEQLPMFPDFEGRGGKGVAKNKESSEIAEGELMKEVEQDRNETQLPDVESWNFDVPEGGAEQYGGPKESTLLYQKEKGWSVVDSKGEESEISWAGVKLLLAKNYDFLFQTDEKFKKLVQYFEGKQES